MDYNNNVRRRTKKDKKLDTDNKYGKYTKKGVRIILKNKNIKLNQMNQNEPKSTRRGK